MWEEMTTREEFRTRFFDCSSAENVFIEVFVGVLNQNPDFASAQCPVGHFLMNKIFPLMARALFHAMGSNLVKDRNSGIHDRALKRGNDGKLAITRSRETSKRQRLQGEEKTEWPLTCKNIAHGRTFECLFTEGFCLILINCLEVVLFFSL